MNLISFSKMLDIDSGVEYYVVDAILERAVGVDHYRGCVRYMVRFADVGISVLINGMVCLAGPGDQVNVRVALRRLLHCNDWEVVGIEKPGGGFEPNCELDELVGT